MKKAILATLLGVLPVGSLATSWEHVPLVDRTCADIAKDQPDNHPRDCLILCGGSGYEILDEGTWAALDDAGNQKALAALRASSRKDHIRVNVTGEREGSVIHVTSLTIAE